jgi:hypothetical protein
MARKVSERVEVDIIECASDRILEGTRLVSTGTENMIRASKPPVVRTARIKSVATPRRPLSPRGSELSILIKWMI